ncbi:MAG: IclR family transcriptional regulator [Eubacteriales bacterium]|nr:IclR family transcriptional regulator [Eubacteriales bacterium]
MNETKAKSNMIQSVERAIKILDTFAQQNNELGVTEIANMLELKKSTIFGILATLEKYGFVQQNPATGKYNLGLKLLELGMIMQDNMDIRTVARPSLKDLVDQYKETVHLVIQDRDEVVNIDKIEGPSAINIRSRIGKRNPIHATGVGKCLLAYNEAHEIEKITGKELKRYTPNTITEPDLLKKELERIREKGYSIDHEEIEEGLRCIAAPIKDHRGRVIGAISLSGPSVRITDEKKEEIAESVKEAAFSISKRLGFRKS